MKTYAEAGHSIARQERVITLCVGIAFALLSLVFFLGCRVSGLDLHIKEGALGNQGVPPAEAGSTP